MTADTMPQNRRASPASPSTKTGVRTMNPRPALLELDRSRQHRRAHVPRPRHRLGLLGHRAIVEAEHHPVRLEGIDQADHESPAPP